MVKYTYEDELVELINDSVKNLLKSKQAINSIEIKDKKQNEILDFTDYKAVLDKYSPAEMLIREEEKPYNSIESNQDFFNDKISIDLYTNEEKIREDSFFSDIEVPSYKTSIFRRYSIFEDKEKIYILDHRKAEEKIKMSEYINDYNSNKISRQLVLNPIKINLNKIDIGRYEQKQDLFNKLGFDIELISDKSVIIREIPIIFDIPENNNFFYEILDFDDNENILFKNLRKLVKNISFRKGNTINKDEAIELYKKLMKEEDPYRTYDGKPTIITLEDKDLEKYFER